MALIHAAGIAQPGRLVVIDSKTLNVLTLPGACVAIMWGLLDQVADGDQLAGVMAHETGHIARHDPLVALPHSAGVRVISAALEINLGFADVSSLAGRLVGLSYCRDMGRLAGANGVAYLQSSGLRCDALAEAFCVDGKATRQPQPVGRNFCRAIHGRSSGRCASGITTLRKRVDGAAMGGAAGAVREAVTRMRFPAPHWEREGEIQCTQ